MTKFNIKIVIFDLPLGNGDSIVVLKHSEVCEMISIYKEKFIQKLNAYWYITCITKNIKLKLYVIQTTAPFAQNSYELLLYLLPRSKT